MPHLLVLFASHFAADLSMTVLAPLLPALVETRGLSLALAASLISVQSVIFGLAQPAMGHLVDVVRRAWLLPAVLVLAAAGTAALGLLPSYGGLVLAASLVAAAVGLFHPLGALMVREAARERAGTMLSLHTFAGSAGVAAAPAVALMLLRRLDLAGLVVIGAALLGMAGVAWAAGTHRMPLAPVVVPGMSGSGLLQAPEARNSIRNLSLLALAMLLKVQLESALRVFLPLYYAARPEGTAFGNTMLTVYLAASAAAALGFGYLSDRWGRRPIALGTQVLSPLPVLAFLLAPAGWAPLWLVLSALALSSTTASGIAYAQELLPGRPGLAASIMIGFVSGIAGVLLTPLGALADAVGMHAVLWWLAWLPLAGAPLLGLLPETRRLPARKSAAPAPEQA